MGRVRRCVNSRSWRMALRKLWSINSKGMLFLSPYPLPTQDYWYYRERIAETDKYLPTTKGLLHTHRKDGVEHLCLQLWHTPRCSLALLDLSRACLRTYRNILYGRSAWGIRSWRGGICLRTWVSPPEFSYQKHSGMWSPKVYTVCILCRQHTYGDWCMLSLQPSSSALWFQEHVGRYFYFCIQCSCRWDN